MRRCDVEILPDGRVYIFIRKSKTDQESHGRRVYIPHTTFHGFPVAAALRDHAVCLDAAGVPPEGALFGDWHAPAVFLGTPREERGDGAAARPASGTIAAAARPTKPGDALVRQLKRYISELRDLGQITIAPELVAAHSLRRTAANEFRDACRAQGIPDGQITAYLLCFCRWVSEKSVQVYVMQHANDMVRILAGAPPTSS